MHALLVHAFAPTDPLGDALREAAHRGLDAGGHAVDVLDLERAGFAPVMPPAEWSRYGRDASDDPLVQWSIERVERATTLAFVYPTRWGGVPAVLKGWFERVLVPDVAFRFDDTGRVRAALRNVRRIEAVATYDHGRLASALTGDNGRWLVSRALRNATGWRTRLSWHGLHLATATPASSARFVEHVERALGRAR